jgi:hypothetical protein
MLTELATYLTILIISVAVAKPILGKPSSASYMLDPAMKMALNPTASAHLAVRQSSAHGTTSIPGSFNVLRSTVVFFILSPFNHLMFIFNLFFNTLCSYYWVYEFPTHRVNALGVERSLLFTF